MNREQYLAKREWKLGPSRESEPLARTAGVDEASPPPTTSPGPSLAEYYRSLHEKDGAGGPVKLN